MVWGVGELIGQGLGFISTGLSIASAVQQYSAYESAKESAKKAAEIESQQKETELRKLRAAQHVAYAAAGVEPEGTPTVVANESARQGDLDLQLIKLKGDMRAEEYGSKASAALLSGGASSIQLFSKLW